MKMLNCIFVVLLFFSSAAYSQSQEDSSSLPTIPILPEQVLVTPLAPPDYFVFVNYSPMDLIIPSKIGATAGLFTTERSTWEIEYLRGSVSVPMVIDDIGSMTDERISLIRRKFRNKNFNFSYGLTYYKYNIHLGSEIINSISGGGYPGVDVVEIQSLGFNVGMGHRWTFKHNITLGVDWISWSQPAYTLKKQADFLHENSNPEDRDNVETAVNVISFFPRLTFLKLQLGILF